MSSISEESEMIDDDDDDQNGENVLANNEQIYGKENQLSKNLNVENCLGDLSTLKEVSLYCLFFI